MTTGGLIVAEQALYALWGPQIIPLPLPTSLRGSFIIGDVAIANTGCWRCSWVSSCSPASS